MNKTNSPIFGESISPSRAQEVYIKGMVENSPIAVFSMLDALINKRGYRLFIVKEHGDDFDVVSHSEKEV